MTLHKYLHCFKANYKELYTYVGLYGSGLFNFDALNETIVCFVTITHSKLRPYMIGSVSFDTFIIHFVKQCPLLSAYILFHHFVKEK